MSLYLHFEKLGYVARRIRHGLARIELPKKRNYYYIRVLLSYLYKSKIIIINILAILAIIYQLIIARYHLARIINFLRSNELSDLSQKDRITRGFSLKLDLAS